MKNTIINNLDILICPICGEDVDIINDIIVCKNNHKFPVKNNIPLMVVDDNVSTKHSVTQKIKAFYEKHLFYRIFII